MVPDEIGSILRPLRWPRCHEHNLNTRRLGRGQRRPRPPEEESTAAQQGAVEVHDHQSQDPFASLFTPLYHLEPHASPGNIGLNETDRSLGTGGTLPHHPGQNQRIADLHQGTVRNDVNDSMHEMSHPCADAWVASAHARTTRLTNDPRPS